MSHLIGKPLRRKRIDRRKSSPTLGFRTRDRRAQSRTVPDSGKMIDMTIAVHVLFRIDPPIAATRDVAGKQYNIYMPLGPGRLTLPRGHETPSHDVPTLTSGWPPFPGSAPPLPLRPIGAGWAVGSLSVVPSQHQLNIEAMSCRLSVTEEIATEQMFINRLSTAVSDWLEIVRGWIGAWTRAPQERLTQQLHLDLVVAYKPKSQWMRLTSRGSTSPPVLGSPLVSNEQLRAAFSAASAACRLSGDARGSLTLPIEHQMYLRALTNDRLGNQRSAVIDACCAAELAMGSVVRAALRAQGIDDARSDKVIERASGVVEMFRLYLVAHGSAISDGRVINELAGPRNRAAHGGRTPSPEEMERALATSRLVLDEASPLASPTDLLHKIRTFTRAFHGESGSQE